MEEDNDGCFCLIELVYDLIASKFFYALYERT
jgi:hypothetical protein